MCAYSVECTGIMYITMYIILKCTMVPFSSMTIWDLYFFANLKGVCHEIFDLHFFIIRTHLGP